MCPLGPVATIILFRYTKIVRNQGDLYFTDDKECLSHLTAWKPSRFDQTQVLQDSMVDPVKMLVLQSHPAAD